jgi:hypothetical protein
MTMDPTGTFDKTPAHLEAEIKALEQALAAKKAAFEAGQPGAEGKFSEKEALHEVVKERYIEAVPQPVQTTSAQPAPVPPQQNAQAVQHAQQVGKLRAEQQIKQLINLMLEKGVFYAVDVAKNMDPYTMDEFHHALVDKFFDEMVKRNIISEM